jgi:hypothetical protein
MVHAAFRCTAASFLRFSLALLLVLPVVSGCSRKDEGGSPVATPTLTLGRDRVAIGSPLKLTYKFEVAPDASFDGDYLVFVHVLDPDGERLWDDDHAPPVPTSQWKPGQVVEYSRTIFVPNYPYIGEASISLGLYRNDTRLVLSGTDAARRAYLVGRLQLLPQSENIFLIYKDGWHPAEVAADNPSSEWQWTQQKASISFLNPKKDATVYLEYDARVDLFTPPQQVTVALSGQPIGTFTADAKERRLVTFPVTAAQFGTAEMAELTIETDKTFKPGGADTRELGIRVFHAFVEPK